MTANRRTAPASIAVVGDGVLAHVTAIALRRALPVATIALAKIGGGDRAEAEEASLALPAAISNLALAGVDEPTLVASGLAMHRLCEWFDGWGPARFAVDHSPAQRAAGAALHQLWLAHGSMPYDALSPAVALAKENRFTPERDIDVDAALALDQRGLRDRLALVAGRAGIAQVTLQADGVIDDGIGLGGLALADGRVITPDLIVTTSSPRSPDDQLIRIQERDLPISAALHDDYVRTPTGWRALWRGPAGDREVVADLHAGAATPLTRSGWRSSEYRVHKGLRPFCGNVVSLAASTGPFLRLDLSVGLQLLGLLIELLPATPPEPLLVAEFNRRANAITEEALAFVAAFDATGDRVVCEGVTPTLLAAFKQNGRLPQRSSDVIGNGAWFGLLIGLGIRPARAEAIARSVPANLARSALAERVAAATAAATRFPLYRDWLRTTR